MKGKYVTLTLKTDKHMDSSKPSWTANAGSLWERRERKAASVCVEVRFQIPETSLGQR